MPLTLTVNDYILSNMPSNNFSDIHSNTLFDVTQPLTYADDPPKWCTAPTLILITE